MINNHVEAAKIGRQIAEQVLDYQRRVGDSSSGELLSLIVLYMLLFKSF
jgi:hypothetical protein